MSACVSNVFRKDHHISRLRCVNGGRGECSESFYFFSWALGTGELEGHEMPTEFYRWALGTAEFHGQRTAHGSRRMSQFASGVFPPNGRKGQKWVALGVKPGENRSRSGPEWATFGCVQDRSRFQPIDRTSSCEPGFYGEDAAAVVYFGHGSHTSHAWHVSITCY